ncbi:bifunctional 4-hydroxy-2-oxoglutarate aldolase/2-dehydro-3-deoxy-phosphogluconate aldolase [Micromonospora costi]|uniref:2-dehydro-3-deoxy-phosphogluconate aldolase n=1 Tax=Micromonospora costi TaxID=1530042 RepID=A0A3B0A6C2_9ACTN|nr:bifunctional 4-hydroxy-2-oxoglutarate aldolase/2-dehydro-3-deoxy-phosphogluconate aldolase [Micromonospora costi]RKN55406.1 bifunctional 4-hydroxy-2-oxoglutarate aldolase/2-dehydro-3-deoxy-phosphogluconate aldolase [Micromonospora costi]
MTTDRARSPQNARDLVSISPVIPVVVVAETTDPVSLATALLRGGVGIMEVTLRTGAALDAIRRIAHEVPGMVVGAGTVTTGQEAEQARAAGAGFLVSPGTTPDLVRAARDTGLPYLPAVSTVSEMLGLRELGLDTMKFFPAAASGGPAFLSAVAGPLPQLMFCPTGGVSPATAADWLRLPNVGCVGGTWLTPADALAAGDWTRVEELARATARLRDTTASSS